MKLSAALPAVLSLLALASLPAAAQGNPEPCLPALTMADNGDGTFTLTWLAIDNATAYQVLVRPAGGDWTPLSPQVPPSSTTFTYQGQAGGVYHFAVVALHGGSTPIVTFCTVSNAPEPPCPTGLTAARVEGGVRLEWDAVAEADGYNAYGPNQDGPSMFLGHTQSTSMVVPDGGDGAYTVASTAGGHEAASCPSVRLAEVPFFPAPAALAAALGGAGIGVLALWRRP
jgi:hypothetical protein